MTREQFEKAAFGQLKPGEVIIQCQCGLDGCLEWQITREEYQFNELLARIMTGGCAANQSPIKAFFFRM